jgi:DNA-binding HxlR family transcriptional regulator
MADKKSNPPKILESWNELMKKIESLSKMSLEDRVKKLQNLKKRREEIELELKDINAATMYLEHMPDIARYKVSNSEASLSLLVDLKKKGDIAYGELRASLPKDSLYDIILNYHLDLLETAQLIKKQSKPDNSGDYIIKLTKSINESFIKKSN